MKRTIKTVITSLLLFATVFANAQIKVHSDGQISLGSIGKTYGLQVHPSGYTSFTNPNSSASIVTRTSVSMVTKSWVVQRLGSAPTTLFYVSGLGGVYTYSTNIMSNPDAQSFLGYIENPSNTLNQIQGFYYNPVNETKDNMMDSVINVGLSAVELGKVIPEAVEVDEEGNMFINYNVLTVFLIEAVKEQQQEIESLRSILKENNLLK
jgi:hypothetical protein